MRDRLLEKGLIAASYVFYHKMIYNVDKHRSNFDRASKCCWPLILHDGARLHTTNQMKKLYLTLNFEIIRHPTYNPDMAANSFHLFRIL